MFWVFFNNFFTKKLQELVILCTKIVPIFSGCQDGEKRAKHGHRGSFKVILQMKLHTIGTWSVEFSGRHVPVASVWEPPKKNLLRNTEVTTAQGILFDTAKC